MSHDSASFRVLDRRGGDGPFREVANESGVRSAVATLADELGSPSIVVNCAGTGTSVLMAGPGATLTGDRFRCTLEVNALGTYFGV